jgi:peptidoglycan/LPS O-acetylase OafA/YrhL
VPNNSHHRSDIQGLRAMAVILVIAGHLFPLSVKGGFIGVDIFFVISGFVITLQMTKLYSTNPSTFLRDFYSKRIKRILPSALLVTILSLLATSYYLGPVAVNEAKLDGGWTTVFLGNFHFHNMSLDYFDAGTQASPLQHYWSLSIEEQFYLIWPGLFLILMIKAKSLRTRQFALLAIIGFSLSMALYLSEIKSDPIFFLSSTRVWELACGALLGLSTLSMRLPRSLINLSLGILLVASIIISPTMQWPGLLTVPVVLATAVILMNRSSREANKLLDNEVMLYLGDISYLLYLWHWPIFIIIKGVSGSFGNLEKLYIGLLTFALSVITHHFFENPIRFSTKTKPGTSIFLGISAVAVVSGALFVTHQG